MSSKSLVFAYLIKQRVEWDTTITNSGIALYSDGSMEYKECTLESDVYNAFSEDYKVTKEKVIVMQIYKKDLRAIRDILNNYLEKVKDMQKPIKTTLLNRLDAILAIYDTETKIVSTTDIALCNQQNEVTIINILAEVSQILSKYNVKVYYNCMDLKDDTEDILDKHLNTASKEELEDTIDESLDDLFKDNRSPFLDFGVSQDLDSLFGEDSLFPDFEISPELDRFTSDAGLLEAFFG